MATGSTAWPRRAHIALRNLPKPLTGLGFRVWGSGFGVSGLEFRVLCQPGRASSSI